MSDNYPIKRGALVFRKDSFTISRIEGNRSQIDSLWNALVKKYSKDEFVSPSLKKSPEYPEKKRIFRKADEFLTIEKKYSEIYLSKEIPK